jgi:hypothetical protein
MTSPRLPTKCPSGVKLDANPGSLIEAGVDNVTIIRQ